MKLVWIKWVDASSFSDRKPLDLALQDKAWECETGGLVLAEDKKSITIGQTLFHRPDMAAPELDNYVIIPKGWIIDRKEWEV